MARRELDVADRAIDDLRSIRNYTTQRWGEWQAQEYVQLIWSKLDLLSLFPERGVMVGEDFGSYRKLITEHHVDYYRVTETTVKIARVLHEAAQILPEMLGE